MGRWQKIFLIIQLGTLVAGVHATEATWQALAQTFPQLLHRAAPDFTLPDLQGQTHQLSKQKGKWTLLVFWATWCGVCRANLPQVQALQQAVPHLAIWGISLDQGPRTVVAQEADRDQLKFLILHDAQGITSTPYQASAIPVAYLVSPQLNLVAKVAGGFGWSSPAVVQNLQKIIQDADPGDPPAALAATEASLPGERLAIPELDLAFISPQTLQAKISWPDAALKYRIKVPRLELPPGVQIKNVAARPGTNTLTYVYDLKFSGRASSYFIGPVTMTFTDHLGRGEQSSRHPGIKIELPANKTKMVGMISLLACLVLLGLGLLVRVFLRRRKLRQASLTNAPGAPILKWLPPTWMEEVANLKRWQMDHAPSDYAIHVLQLCQQWHQAQGQADEHVDQLLMDVRYGGQSLAAAELVYYEKIILAAYQNLQKGEED